MTRAKATAAPAPAPTETVAETAAPEVVAAPADEPHLSAADPTPPAPTDLSGLPSTHLPEPPAPEAPAGIHLRTTRGVDLVNPYTTQKITTAGVEVVRLDGWLDFQLESGKIERYTPEPAAE